MPRHRPYRQRPMNPLPGIWDEPATVPGYCHASPNGEINVGSRPTANYSLLTANSLTFHLLRQRKGLRNRSILLRITVLQLGFECVAERGPDE